MALYVTGSSDSPTAQLAIQWCCEAALPLRVEGAPAGVHKAADAKARCRCRLLALLYTEVQSRQSS